MPTKPSLFYVLRDRIAFPCDDLVTAGKAREAAPEGHRVATTVVAGTCEVSTVFLMIDHSGGHGEPQLFETMVFLHDAERPDTRSPVCMRRYSTWADAHHGHEEVVALLQRELASAAALSAAALAAIAAKSAATRAQ